MIYTNISTDNDDEDYGNDTVDNENDDEDDGKDDDDNNEDVAAHWFPLRVRAEANCMHHHSSECHILPHNCTIQ